MIRKRLSSEDLLSNAVWRFCEHICEKCKSMGEPVEGMIKGNFLCFNGPEEIFIKRGT